ncbi:hypothetical protein OB236_34215 [Paenibacillus sp. WQ 127069]|uniref:Uncharacterized protein n=1 Tax=Paenibacillus baimaensis TaxID=2982185 RepID=A0ABT2URM8_9BACL|nr:hypothetical protein [Paenibacillus sp. WQ 127069]
MSRRLVWKHTANSLLRPSAEQAVCCIGWDSISEGLMYSTIDTVYTVGIGFNRFGV